MHIVLPEYLEIYVQGSVPMQPRKKASPPLNATGQANLHKQQINTLSESELDALIYEVASQQDAGLTLVNSHNNTAVLKSPVSTTGDITDGGTASLRDLNSLCLAPLDDVHVRLPSDTAIPIQRRVRGSLQQHQVTLSNRSPSDIDLGSRPSPIQGSTSADMLSCSTTTSSVFMRDPTSSASAILPQAMQSSGVSHEHSTAFGSTSNSDPAVTGPAFAQLGTTHYPTTSQPADSSASAGTDLAKEPDVKQCTLCGDIKTSVWRVSRLAGHEGQTLCNACGLYENKKGTQRPQNLIDRSRSLNRINKRTKRSHRAINISSTIVYPRYSPFGITPMVPPQPIMEAIPKWPLPPLHSSSAPLPSPPPTSPQEGSDPSTSLSRSSSREDQSYKYYFYPR